MTSRVDLIGITDVDRVDKWFDNAMRDDSVRPWLSTGINTPRLEIPEDNADGLILMTANNKGLIRLYNEPEMQAVIIGIWVLSPKKAEYKRRDIADALMTYGLTFCRRPDIKYVGCRVASSNDHGMNFAKRLYGTPWGVESEGFFDPALGKWVDWVHFRTPVANII